MGRLIGVFMGLVWLGLALHVVDRVLALAVIR